MPSETDLRRHASGRSAVSGMTEDMRTHAPPPTPALAPDAATPVGPVFVPHICDVMPYEELRELRKYRGFATRDAKSLLRTRLLATDRIDQMRARDETETESSAAKKRSLIAALQSPCAADKGVAKRHGQWRGPVMKDRWGALPGTPVDGVDVAI